MPMLRLAFPLLLLSFLLDASIERLHAQFFDPTMEGVCPATTGYGAAYGYFIKAVANPDGQEHHLANKYCFTQDLDLSDEKSMDSSTNASSATASFSYHAGSGTLSLQAEVKASGHFIKVTDPGGFHTVNGQGLGNVTLWVKWADTFTLHSKTTKPAHDGMGVKVDPSQIVEITLKLLNKDQNQCTGIGDEGSVYKTSALLQAETDHKILIGGHENLYVNSDCNEQQNSGPIQVLLGVGQFRVEMGASAMVGAHAQHGNGFSETVDVKVKLGEYKFCMQVTKGPPDLTITSASGTVYTCPKK